MDVEKDIVIKKSTPSVNQIEVQETEEKSQKLDRKLKQSYFARRPSNIVEEKEDQVSGSKVVNSDGFPGSSKSSDESAQEVEGTRQVYVTSVDFDETNINQLVHYNRDSGRFANTWSMIILVGTTYNFITCWYFLGLAGFPNGYWLTVEIVIEIVLFFDFFLRIYIKQQMPNTWKTMWLMQHKKQSDGGVFDPQVFMMFLASLPQSWVFYLIFSEQTGILTSLPIAASRMLKLLRFPQIDKFFETKEIESQVQKSHRSMRSLQVVFYFLLATHMIGCIWLIIGRIDPDRDNWFAMAKYTGENAANNVREVTTIEKYIDAVFYTVATMTGLGYGNIVPSTNLEYFVDIFIMITGCSIYAGFFADFAVEIYNQNKKTIENEQKLEQAKQFALQRNLPDDLRLRIRLYYNNARLNFQILKDKFQILHQLPLTLRSELSLFFNRELIQKVKFFQLAEPSFILAISKSLCPQICLQKDFVVYLDQVATKMFFIQQGIVQILATDYKTVIALQSQGCYFGEIGVLLTEKRTCSVKAVTMCIFMTITKEELETIFESYPQQAKFLRAVGRQRLLTTKPEDLVGYEENVFEAGNGENVRVDDLEDHKSQISKKTINFLAKSIVGKDKPSTPTTLDQNTASAPQKISSIKKGLSSSMRINSLNTSMSHYNLKSRVFAQGSEIQDEDQVPNSILKPETEAPSNKDRIFNQDFRQSSKKSTGTKNTLPWNLTEDYKNETQFVIIPFSRLFNIWTTFMLCSTFYFLFMVPYQLALDYQIYEEAGLPGLIPDIIFNLSFFTDVFLRSRLAFVIDERGGSDIITDLDQIQDYYVNRILIYDVLSGIPFEYLMIPIRAFGYIGKLTTYMRLLKFFKAVRIYETVTIIKRHSNISNAFMTFALLFGMYGVLAHFMATSYIFIGRREVGYSSRFDGQTMFGDVTGRIFMTPTEEIENRDFPFLGPAEEMGKFQLYIQFIYLSSCTMGAVMYGDIIPFTISEQLFDFIAMFTCRMFLAFLFAEGASYLSSVHKSASQHTKKVAQIMDWSDLNQLPKTLKIRIVRFYDILWKNFRGVRQQQILGDLPVSLRMDVRQCLFKDIIENWEVMIGNEDHGVVSSIIQNFELRIIPQDEFIIKYGEIAQDMYFIIKGQVNCISREGIHLSQIGVGKIFGAEILQKGSVRSSTIQAATDVSVAIMTTEDFLKICELYPSFKKRILQIVISREQENKEQINKVTEETKINEIIGEPQNQDDNNQTVSEEEGNLESAPSFSLNQPIIVNSSTVEKSQIELTGTPQNHIKTDNSLRTPAAGDSMRLVSHAEESVSGRKLLGSERDQISVLTPSEYGQDQDEFIQYKKKKINDMSSSTTKKRSGSMISNAGTRSARGFTRVSLRAGGIDEHFEIGKNQYHAQFNKIKNKHKICSTRQFMRWSILFIAIYNIIFIPLQFAYRIKFDGFFLMMEIFTIILYAFDIKFRVKNLRLLRAVGGNLPESENLNEQALMGDKDQFAKRIALIKLEIICSAIAIVPFSLIFQSNNYHEPLIFVNTFCLFRIVKLMPLIKLFEFLKSRNLQKWRVIEVVVIYYLLCHLSAGVWISMGQFVPDVRETWVRRIPVPQSAGMRQNPTLDDLSPLSLYIHALWFIANTVSHVAIGDITACTSEERVFVAIFIWFATFLYSFLFGNIVSIVSDFAPKHQMLYFEKYQYVMQRLGPMKKNKGLVRSINEYFDYIWGHEEAGSIEELFIGDLPQCIKSDILLCKYQEAIESSLIFKDDSGAVDVSLCNSIIKLMEIRIYMTNEYIFKVGSYCPQSYILLEGQTVLAGACRLFNGIRSPNDKYGDIIGIMKVGGHFGTDLPNEQYNYGQKTTCHMISTQPSVLGVICKENLKILYRSYPEWRKKMQCLNGFMFGKCEQNLRKHHNSIKKQIQQKVLHSSPSRKIEKLSEKEYRLLYLEHHITYSTEEVYDQIIQSLDQFLERQKNAIHTMNSDLVISQKIFFYGQEGKVFPIFDSQYQKALKKASHESLIAQVLSGQGGISPARPIEHGEQEENIDWEEKLLRRWQKFYFKANSRGRKVIDFVHAINLLYIAIITPLVIGFSLEMTYTFNMMESLSLLVSIAWVITNFRTQAQIKGVPTLKYSTLLKHYKNNGLFLDILGIIPFNLMLGQNSPENSIVIRSLFRTVRVFSSWKAVELFRKAEVSYKNNKLNVVMQVLKALFYIYFLGHFLACTFFFIINKIEDDAEETWIDYNQLKDESVGVQYLRSIYTVFNVVCSVGYGDMFPMTDLERVVFTVMITIGDLLFALAFGLIARLTLQISLTDETKQFRDKMYQIQEFMNSFNLDHAQQRRVEQYFAYQYKQKYNSHLINNDDLIAYLPHSLREEVVYQSSKSLLTSMFKEYKSENLIRKLAVVLESAIYLPGDFILYKGDIGEEMYFIAEGSVRSLSDDKQTINKTLHKGSFFGETAIIFPTKRQNSIQAETFCIIRVLKGEDFRYVAQDFPDIHKQLQERAAQTQNSNDSNDSFSAKPSGIEMLNTTELKRFHEDHIDGFKQTFKTVNIESEEVKEEKKKTASEIVSDIIHEENSSQYTTQKKKEGEETKKAQVIVTNVDLDETNNQQSQGPVSNNSRKNHNRSREQRGEGEKYEQINSSSDQTPQARLTHLNLKQVSDEEESLSSRGDKKQSRVDKIENDLEDFFSEDESSEHEQSKSKDCPSARRPSVARHSGFASVFDEDSPAVVVKTPSSRIAYNKKLINRNQTTNLDSFFSATGQQQSAYNNIGNYAKQKTTLQKKTKTPDTSPKLENHFSDPSPTGNNQSGEPKNNPLKRKSTLQSQTIQNLKFSPQKSANKLKRPTRQPSLADIFKHSEADACVTIRRTTTNPQQQNQKQPQSPQKKMPVRRLSRVSLGKNLTLSSAAGLKLQWTVSS